VHLNGDIYQSIVNDLGKFSVLFFIKFIFISYHLNCKFNYFLVSSIDSLESKENSLNSVLLLIHVSRGWHFVISLFIEMQWRCYHCCNLIVAANIEVHKLF